MRGVTDLARTFTVSIIGFRGGIGRTSLALSLAGYAAIVRQLRVLAIDLDRQGSMTQILLGEGRYSVLALEKCPTANHLFGQRQPDFSSLAVHIKAGAAHIDLVPSIFATNPELTQGGYHGDRLADYLSSVGSNYDLIVLDTSPSASVPTIAAIRSANLLLIPCEEDANNSRALELMADVLTDTRGEHGLACARTVAATRTRSRDAITRTLPKERGWPVLRKTLRYSESLVSPERGNFPTPAFDEFIRGAFAPLGEEILAELPMP